MVSISCCPVIVPTRAVVVPARPIVVSRPASQVVPRTIAPVNTIRPLYVPVVNPAAVDTTKKKKDKAAKKPPTSPTCYRNIIGQEERRIKMCNELVINGTVYVPKESKTEGMPYVMVRTHSAGVFAGFLESRNGQEVVLKNARRIWYWEGAASLSQLAMEGTKEPSKCKFPMEVDRVELLQAIEIINITEKAKKSIVEVPVWKR